MIINLYKDHGAYLAQFIGDPEIPALFGTDILPTGYTDQSNPGEVIEDMQRFHPQRIVVVTDRKLNVLAFHGGTGCE